MYWKWEQLSEGYVNSVCNKYCSTRSCVFDQDFYSWMDFTTLPLLAYSVSVWLIVGFISNARVIVHKCTNIFCEWISILIGVQTVIFIYLIRVLGEKINVQNIVFKHASYWQAWYGKTLGRIATAKQPLNFNRSFTCSIH